MGSSNLAPFSSWINSNSNQLITNKKYITFMNQSGLMIIHTTKLFYVSQWAYIKMKLKVHLNGIHSISLGIYVTRDQKISYYLHTICMHKLYITNKQFIHKLLFDKIILITQRRKFTERNYILQTFFYLTENIILFF